MIPRKAFFCWGGGEMPWIRQKSVESFHRHNPSWDVEIINVDGDSKGDIVRKSDRIRYERLAEEGGAYFDTDIFFLKPLDALMELIGDSDTVVCFELTAPMNLIKADGTIERNAIQSRFYSVASLMSCPSNDFWREAYNYSCRPDVLSEPDYQACGIWTMTERFKSLDNAMEEFPHRKFHNLHKRAFLPVAYDDVRSLYRQGSDGLVDELRSDPEVFGVHWFGGDNITRISELWTPDLYWKDCAMGRLLGEA